MPGRIPGLVAAVAAAVLFNLASILARKRAVSTFWGELE
jgi:archaellin